MQLISVLLAVLLLGFLVIAQIKYYVSKGFGHYELIQCLINSSPLLVYVIILSIPVKQMPFWGRIIVWLLLVCVFVFNLLGYLYAVSLERQFLGVVSVAIYILSFIAYVGGTLYLRKSARSSSEL
jgi:hypothetical protein